MKKIFLGILLAMSVCMAFTASAFAQDAASGRHRVSVYPVTQLLEAPLRRSVADRSVGIAVTTQQPISLNQLTVQFWGYTPQVEGMRITDEDGRTIAFSYRDRTRPDAYVFDFEKGGHVMNGYTMLYLEFSSRSIVDYGDLQNEEVFITLTNGASYWDKAGNAHAIMNIFENDPYNTVCLRFT